MPLYVFDCECGEATEALVSRGSNSSPCACGRTAQRRQVYATAIGGRVRTPVSERPVDLHAFTEASEQMAHEHSRAEESAQHSIPEPSLFKEAMRRAKTLQRAGITDSLDYRPEYFR